jgi:hypothetical protein
MLKISLLSTKSINPSTKLRMGSTIIGGKLVMIIFVLHMSNTGKIYNLLLYSIFKSKDYQVDEIEPKINSDWKKNMKLGLQIKQNWSNVAVYKKNIIPNFTEDSQQMCDELYFTLKGNYLKFDSKIFPFLVIFP